MGHLCGTRWQMLVLVLCFRSSWQCVFMWIRPFIGRVLRLAPFSHSYVIFCLPLRYVQLLWELVTEELGVSKHFRGICTLCLRANLPAHLNRLVLAIVAQTLCPRIFERVWPPTPVATSKHCWLSFNTLMWVLSWYAGFQTLTGCTVSTTDLVLNSFLASLSHTPTRVCRGGVFLVEKHWPLVDTALGFSPGLGA